MYSLFTGNVARKEMFELAGWIVNGYITDIRNVEKVFGTQSDILYLMAAKEAENKTISMVHI